MQHALSDIRVLDITQVMAEPFCAMLLCDMLRVRADRAR